MHNSIAQGFFGEKRIGTGFNEAIIDAISDHHPAKAGSALKERVFDWQILFLAYALQGECGGEPADTASDDGDSTHSFRSLTG